MPSFHDVYHKVSVQALFFFSDSLESCLQHMAAETQRRPFSSLSPEEQEIVREKQRLAKERKKASSDRGQELSDVVVGQVKVGDTEERDYPTKITEEEYFTACPRYFFTDATLMANEEGLEVLMRLVDGDNVIGSDRRGREVRLSQYQYFIFAGSQKQIWDPTFYAKLAFEGFFTITNQDRGGDPLPELQPFYGVVDWANFNSSKHMRKVLKKLKGSYQKPDGAAAADPGADETLDEDLADSSGKYHMYSSLDLDGTYERLDTYQKSKHGCNWMHKKYFITMKVASADPRINFKLHSIELYDGPVVASGSDSGTPVSRSPRLVAGEIGYSIGRVYTSLSGFYEVPGAGTVQLACLGKWLELKKYAFWSLGHCYSPVMEYKRQLGHRVYPRTDFLKKLRQHRGDFRLSDAELEVSSVPGFAVFADREECDLGLALTI